MKICVAVSGGVDSLYALYSLKQQGHELIALHGRFLEKEPDLSLLKKHCSDWNIPLYIIDFREIFYERVILPFVHSHSILQTPNPCAFCNREIKFGLLLEKALELGAKHIATGHYVNTHINPYSLDNCNNIVLSSALDKSKDQSYFLALVKKENLQHAVFPLKNMKKEEIREIFAKENIEIPIPKESQEICFVPNDNHTVFIEEIAKSEKISLSQQGKIKILPSQDDTELEIKNFEKRKHLHKGLWHYTEGQRKGLGISWKKPLYVIERNKNENILYLGTDEYLKAQKCKADSVNFFIPFEYWQKENLFVRTRFRQKMIPAYVDFNQKNNSFSVVFKNEEGLIAKGQVLAVYDENSILLAGAVLI